MSLKNKFRLALIIFIVALVATLVSLYIYRAAADMENRFLERAQYFAMAFADRASLYLSQGKQEDLSILAKTTVLGSVLYIQIVKDGQVILEDKALTIDLAVEHSSAQLVATRRRAADGQPYVDIVHALPLNIEGGQKLNNYVRIGTSLLPLKLEIRNEILIVSGVSLGFIIVSLLAIFYLTKMLFEQPRPLEPAVEASVSAELAEQVPSSPATSATISSALKLGDLLLDDGAKKVSLKGEPVELSPKEYELLKLLASEPGKVFSNEEILEKIWAGREFASPQDVKQYIYFLRRKLEEDPENPKIIITVRGFGYKLEL